MVVVSNAFTKLDCSDDRLSVTKKPAKDPNRSKKPVSAFLDCMEDLMDIFKKDYPNNRFFASWRSLPESEKDLCVSKSDKRKYDYEMYMRAHNKKLEEGTKKKEEDSDNSVAEVE